MLNARLRFAWFLGPFLVSGLLSVLDGRTQAATQFIPGSVGETDSDTVAEVMATFDHADEAMRRKDLDDLMSFYSAEYNYHGLTKSEIRKIWQDLFDNYRDIGSTHIFSVIRKSGPSTALSVEITCTGSLYAVSEATKLQVPIDSWYQEVHFLVKENGKWRIRGNVGDAPKVLPFGTAPHPLF